MFLSRVMKMKMNNQLRFFFQFQTLVVHYRMCIDSIKRVSGWFLSLKLQVKKKNNKKKIIKKKNKLKKNTTIALCLHNVLAHFHVTARTLKFLRQRIKPFRIFTKNKMFS